MNETFKHIGVGQFPSSGEWNRLVDAVSSLLRSTGVQYFSDSRGVHIRETPTAEPEDDIAYCKAAAPDADEIVCYKTVDITGDEITVKCQIANGSSLKYALPYLNLGQEIQVRRIRGVWYCSNCLFTGTRFGP